MFSHHKKTFIYTKALAFILLLATISAKAGNYELLSSLDIKAKVLTTDFLKNVYAVTEDNKLVKYDSTGAVVGTFSDNRYGALSSADATSPFNILLFYKDFATIVTTDMRLTAKRLFRLSSLGINNVSATCLSYDNYVWVYDTDAARLKKINANYEVVQQSMDLRLLLGEAIVPDFLVERDGMVYMNVPKMGILLFDLQGTFYTSVSNTDLGKDDLHNFQVIQQKIVYFDQESLFIYDLASQMQEGIALPRNANIRDVKVERGRLFILTDEKLQVYVQTK
jgi:hypothetical protein